ncbi:MAG: MaoC family dehydratase [Thermoleophilia bacterium]
MPSPRKTPSSGSGDSFGGLLRPDPKTIEGLQQMVDSWSRSWARSMQLMWSFPSGGAVAASAPPADKPAAAAPPPPPAAPAPPPFPTYPPGKTIDQMKVGDSASITRTFTQDDIDAFARLSGDDNPAHVDAEWAAASPFKARVVHGILTTGLVSAVLGTQLPGPGAIYMSQTVRWTAPVFPGDELTATVTVTELIPEKGRAVMETVVSRGDQPVLVGEALVMPTRETAPAASGSKPAAAAKKPAPAKKAPATKKPAAEKAPGAEKAPAAKKPSTTTRRRSSTTKPAGTGTTAPPAPPRTEEASS